MIVELSGAVGVGVAVFVMEASTVVTSGCWDCVTVVVDGAIDVGVSVTVTSTVVTSEGEVGGTNVAVEKAAADADVESTASKPARKKLRSSILGQATVLFAEEFVVHEESSFAEKGVNAVLDFFRCEGAASVTCI